MTVTHTTSHATALQGAKRAVEVDGAGPTTATEPIRYYYLDKRVKGEAVRLTLVIGGVPFEDVRCSYERVAELRAAGTLPFSQVPALQIGDGPLHAQSQALLRWAGKRAGLYPDEHQLRVDAVTDVIVELYTEMIKVGYGAAMTRNPVSGRPMVPLTPAQRAEVARSCGEILFPVRFEQLERLLALGPDGDGSAPASESAPFFCGAELTIADISLYVIASAILDGAWDGNGVGPEVLDGCERLLRVVRRVGEHPRVAAWNAAHPARWFG